MTDPTRPEATDSRNLDPFFVLYDGRSGSTFLSNQLMRRYAVVVPPESNFIARLIREFPRGAIRDRADLRRVGDIAFSDRKLADWAVSRTRVDERVASALPVPVRDYVVAVCSTYADSVRADWRRLGIKKGSYLRSHRRLHRAFPGARFVCLIRDGRAVFSSKRKTARSDRSDVPMESSVYVAADTWCRKRDLIRTIERSYPHVLVVRYEELVSDTDATLARVAAFLDLPAAGAAGSEDTARRLVPERYRHVHPNVDKPPIEARLDAWRRELTAEQVLAYESVAHRHLAAEGYRPVHPPEAFRGARRRVRTGLRRLWARVR